MAIITNFIPVPTFGTTLAGQAPRGLPAGRDCVGTSARVETAANGVPAEGRRGGRALRVERVARRGVRRADGEV